MPSPAARPVTVALALGALLAGCSSDGDDRPGSLPTIKSPTVSPSVSPSPSASSTSDATAASVEAFVTSYYAEINRAIKTGEVDQLRDLSAPGCGCRQLVEFIQNGNGGPQVSGGQFTVRSIALHDVTPDLAAAKVTYDVAPAEIRDSAGKVIRRLPAFTAAQDDLSLIRRNGSWLVAQVLELTQ